MGFNFKICGYPTVEAYVADTVAGGEQAHLRALAGYIRSKKLQAAFRAKNWAAIAKGYNGTGQVDYYAGLLARAYAKLGGR